MSAHPPPRPPGSGRQPSADWSAQPDLVGPRLLLSPLSPADAGDFRRALGDPQEAAAVLEHLAYWPPADDAAASELIEQAVADPTRQAYAQRLRDSGEFVGTTSYYEIDPVLRSIAIGHTWLARRWWRTGINTESKFVMLRHAFDDLGAERVVWHTDIRNNRSQAAILRLGAQREGVLRHHRIRRDGSWRDTAQFSMLSDEWPTVRAQLVAQLPMTVRHEAASSRYEGWLGAELVCVVDYIDRGEEVLVTHTGTVPAWRGNGLAARITREVLADLGERGVRITPVCSFTRQFLRDHPSYARS